MTLSHLEHLQQKYDGPIAEHLKDGRSADDLRAEHIRGMIRFNQQRIVDFTQSLALIQSNMPEGTVKDIWLNNTREIIAFHREDLARQEAELSSLVGETSQLEAAE